MSRVPRPLFRIRMTSSFLPQPESAPGLPAVCARHCSLSQKRASAASPKHRSGPDMFRPAFRASKELQLLLHLPTLLSAYVEKRGARDDVDGNFLELFPQRQYSRPPNHQGAAWYDACRLEVTVLPEIVELRYTLSWASTFQWVMKYKEIRRTLT